jgi:hypothetical protein
MVESDPRSDLQVALRSDEASASLVLAWRKDQASYRVERAQLTDDLRTHFLKLCRTTADDLLNGRRKVDYDPEWHLASDEHFEVPNDPAPGGDLFKQLADYLNVGWFTRGNMTKPTLYVVPVWTPSGTAFFGRRTAQLSVLGRRSKLLKLTWDGEVFDELHDSVVTFSPDFDWVVWPNVEGTMYVLNAVGFHAVFRDLAAVRASVDANVAALTAKIAIENTQEFAERCRVMVPMASKLQRVVSDGLMNRPIADLKKYAQERKIDVTWNGNALVYENSIEKQWNILKLLNEDHTLGPVSGRTFDSPVKRRVS